MRVLQNPTISVFLSPTWIVHFQPGVGLWAALKGRDIDRSGVLECGAGNSSACRRLLPLELLTPISPVKRHQPVRTPIRALIAILLSQAHLLHYPFPPRLLSHSLHRRRLIGQSSRDPSTCAVTLFLAGIPVEARLVVYAARRSGALSWQNIGRE